MNVVLSLMRRDQWTAQNSILELLHLFCFLWQFPESTSCPIKHLVLKKWN